MNTTLAATKSQFLSYKINNEPGDPNQEINNFFLSVLENRASELSGMSKKYRDDAKALNRRSTIFKVAATIGIAGFLFLVARFFIF